MIYLIKKQMIASLKTGKVENKFEQKSKSSRYKTGMSQKWIVETFVPPNSKKNSNNFEGGRV